MPGLCSDRADCIPVLYVSTQHIVTNCCVARKAANGTEALLSWSLQALWVCKKIWIQAY